MAKHADKSDVERQLYFWEKELFGVNKDNQLVWDRLAKAIRKTAQANDIEPEIRNIRNFLMWVTVLKYFEHGFTDKTSEQLQLLIDGQRLLKPAKSKGSNAKYLF